MTLKTSRVNTSIGWSSTLSTAKDEGDKEFWRLSKGLAHQEIPRLRTFLQLRPMRGLLCEDLPTDFSRGLGIGSGTCPTRERGVTGEVPKAKVDPVIHSMYKWCANSMLRIHGPASPPGPSAS